jgi:hypothetical protein
MPGSHTRRALALVVVLETFTSSCEPRCNDGCLSSVQLTAHLAQDSDTLSGSSVTICRNAACSTGTLPELPADTLTTGDFNAEAATTAEGTGTSVRVTLTGGGGYTDGDHYKFTITDGSGTTIFTKDVVADYSEQTICETDCSLFMVDLYP